MRGNVPAKKQAPKSFFKMPQNIPDDYQFRLSIFSGTSRSCPGFFYILCSAVFNLCGAAVMNFHSASHAPCFASGCITRCFGNPVLIISYIWTTSVASELASSALAASACWYLVAISMSSCALDFTMLAQSITSCLSS